MFSFHSRKGRNSAGGLKGQIWHQRTRIAHAVNVNNSDIDFCEWQGRLIINYSWGNQQGVEHLAEAIYDGTESQFLSGWFPDTPNGQRN